MDKSVYNFFDENLARGQDYDTASGLASAGGGKLKDARYAVVSIEVTPESVFVLTKDHDTLPELIKAKGIKTELEARPVEGYPMAFKSGTTPFLKYPRKDLAALLEVLSEQGAKGSTLARIAEENDVPVPSGARRRAGAESADEILERLRIASKGEGQKL